MTSVIRTGPPRIGITPDLNDIEAPETEYLLRRNYADAVLHHGGLPLILPYSDAVAAYLAVIDGLLVTGGMFDIDPALYRQAHRKSVVTKPTRTTFEKALIEGALDAGIPVLGICNGMQLLAVCLGGELVQDIPSDITSAFEHKPDGPATVAGHDVSIVDGSRHLPCISVGIYGVNSVHHQSVLPSDRYRVLAAAADGVVEAIETIEGNFAVGVQWHPEYMVSELDEVVLSGLVTAAADFAARRSETSHA